jgi:hypothetical protein
VNKGNSEEDQQEEKHGTKGSNNFRACCHTPATGLMISALYVQAILWKIPKPWIEGGLAA